MIFYPSSESKTDFTLIPWGSIIISILSIAGFVGVLQPETQKFHKQQEAKELIIKNSVESAFQVGRLKHEFWSEFQGDFHMLGREANNNIFPPAIIRAYQDYTNSPLPLTSIAQDKSMKLLLSIIPHDLYALILGILAILFTGYLFEHLYHHIMILVFYVLSAIFWIFVPPLLTLPQWPPIEMTWSVTIGTLCFLTALRTPTTVITITIKTWFGKFFNFEPNLPVLLLATGYLVLISLEVIFLSEFTNNFSPLSMAMIPVTAFAFALLLFVLPHRPQDTDEELEINQMLARAESYFSNDRHDDAIETLRFCYTQNPTNEQIKRIADIAWKHHDSQLARQGYINLLKAAYDNTDFRKTIALIDEMVSKNLELPLSPLQTAIQIGLQKQMLDEVQRLLPYFVSHQDATETTILALYDQYVDRLITRPNPDKNKIWEILQWLQQHFPESDTTAKVDLYFQGLRTKKHEAVSAPVQKIHKYMEIGLINVTDKELLLKIGADKEQNIPWTAFLGLSVYHFPGVHQGYKGCLFIKFRRKIFACSFSPKDILMKDVLGQQLTMEKLWEIFEQHIPEGAPFIYLDQCEDLSSPDQFEAAANEFVNKNHI